MSSAARQTKFTKVMSILRLIVFTIIAIALVKLVFFPGADSRSDGTQLDPDFAVPQMTATAQKATITNSLKLNGTIAADESTPVKATAAGEVTTVFVQEGTQVQAGAPILEVRSEATQTTNSDDSDADAPAAPIYSYSQVVAATSGKVNVTALQGQTVAIGDEIGSISPGTFSVRAPLQPAQIYRISTLPATAKVTIKDGPAPFDCKNVRMDTGAAAAQKDQAQAQSVDVAVMCDIPAGQKVFAGLAVSLELVAGEAKDVLTLPVTAVDGRYGTGYVYLPGKDSTNPKKQEVTLGITDGTRIEIRKGLDESTSVLEYTPVQEADQNACSSGTGEGC